MADDDATTRVLIYRLEADAATAVGHGLLIDPQVVALHADATERLATELAGAGAADGQAARLRVQLSSDGSVLVVDGSLGVSAPQFGPPIAVVGLDVASSAPVADIAGLAPWDLFVLPPNAEGGYEPPPAGGDVDVDLVAASIRSLVTAAGAADEPLAAAPADPGRPTAPADLVGSEPVTRRGAASAPAVALAHRTVSPLCRLFPWLPFC